VTASDEPGKSEFIDRLLEKSAEPSTQAASAEDTLPDPVPLQRAPRQPVDATYVVQDEDWEGGRPAPAIRTEERLDRKEAIRHAARLAVFALACIGAIAGLLVAWMHVTSDPLADVRAYYDAATRLNAGRALYPKDIDPSTNLAYLYPPLLAIVFRPLAALGYGIFAFVWEGVVLVSFALLLRTLGVRSQRTWLAVGLLGIPIGWALAVAQAQVPLTLLLAVGQPWTIALAANIKLFPALIVLWWIGRRDFETVAAFFAWSGLFVVVQLVLEPTGTTAYLGTVGLGQLGHVRNISPFVVSPELWAVLVAVGIGVTVLLSRTRWGWAAAVTLSTLASPRLLVYMLTGLLAAIREPTVSHLPQPEPRPWRHVMASRR
jgi:hypothetical protein